MYTVLNSDQRRMIPHFLLHRLGHKGNTIRDLGVSHFGDSSQLPYGNHSVWHRKHDLDGWLAIQLRLPSSLWGPKRRSNALMRQTSNELAKLRKKGIVADWSSTKRTTLFRLTDPKISIPMPIMSMDGRKIIHQNDEHDMKKIFLSISFLACTSLS